MLLSYDWTKHFQLLDLFKATDGSWSVVVIALFLALFQGANGLQIVAVITLL